MRQWGLIGLLLLSSVARGHAGVVIVGPDGLPPQATVATLPPSATIGQQYVVTDGADASDCTVGAGSTSVTCWWNGTAWIAMGTSVSGSIPTREQVFTAGPDVTTATSLSTAVYDGDEFFGTCRYTDGAGVAWNVACNKAKTEKYSRDVFMAAVPWNILNKDLDPCNTIDNVTGALTKGSAGTCASNIATTDGTETLTNKTILHTPNVRTSSPYTLLASDCGKTIANNVAATGDLEVDLLADMTGCTVCFFSEGGGTITVDPDGTDTLISTVSPVLSAGDRIRQDAGVGKSFCVEGKNSTTIYVHAGSGSLTDAN